MGMVKKKSSNSCKGHTVNKTGLPIPGHHPLSEAPWLISSVSFRDSLCWAGAREGGESISSAPFKPLLNLHHILSNGYVDYISSIFYQVVTYIFFYKPSFTEQIDSCLSECVANVCGAGTLKPLTSWRLHSMQPLPRSGQAKGHVH